MGSPLEVTLYHVRLSNQWVVSVRKMGCRLEI